jgi:TonB family protein
VGTQSILVPGFTSRKASTQVTSRSGETIVIAGLLTYKDSHAVSQVPGLGSIPVFGRLFRTPQTEESQREVIIAVTPELAADEALDADRGLALERALAVAEVTASVEDARLRYALTVQERIASALRYPQRERELNLDGTVKLKLHLFADGTLGRTAVTSSSGLEALDAEALKAAESQAPYPPFPSTVSERELWLEIPVIFRP